MFNLNSKKMNKNSFKFDTDGFRFPKREIRFITEILISSNEWHCIEYVNNDCWHVAVKASYAEKFRDTLERIGFL